MCALRFIDGFDDRPGTMIAQKWTTVVGGATTITAGAGRNGTRALDVLPNNANGASKTLDAQPTWIVGFAFRYPSYGGAASTILSFRDAGTDQASLVLNVDGTLQVVRSTSTAVASGTSTQTILADTYYYIEMKVTIADSIAAGSCRVRVNGLDWIAVAAGQDLKATANASANQIWLGSAGTRGAGTGSYLYDDVYICDGTGPVHDDFLGDVMVETLHPDGAGGSTQWTPLAGSNWQNVDDVLANDETDYNTAGADGLVDLYTLSDLRSTPATIHGVQWVGRIRKDDAASYVLNRSVRSGGAAYHGATAIAPNTTYVTYSELIEQDPATSAAWTEGGVNALEAGVKLVTRV